MGTYVLNMMFALLLVGGLAVGALWLWKRLPAGGAALFGARRQSLHIRSAVQLGVNSKLIVVEFADRQMLLSATRQGVTVLADTVITNAPENETGALPPPDFPVLLDRALVVPSLPTAKVDTNTPPAPKRRISKGGVGKGEGA